MVDTFRPLGLGEAGQRARRPGLRLDLGPTGGEGPVSAVLEGAFHRLFDDAAVFPPGDLPLLQAVPAHQGHRSAWYAPFVGSFVCPAARADEVDAPLELSLTLPQGPSGLPDVLDAWGRRPLGRLVAVEVVPPPSVPAAETLAVLDAHLPDGVTGFVEVPRGERQSDVLDALVGTRYRAKFRTGGLVPQAHPDEADLAGSVLAAVRREVPFKCTAGLHHAVRHTDLSCQQRLRHLGSGCCREHEPEHTPLYLKQPF